MLAITQKNNTLQFAVSVKASARQDRIVGEEDSRLKIEVTARPVEGKANRAVRDIIARSLNVAPSRVAIVSGEKSRLKRVSVSGIAREAIERLARPVNRT